MRVTDILHVRGNKVNMHAGSKRACRGSTRETPALHWAGMARKLYLQHTEINSLWPDATKSQALAQLPIACSTLNHTASDGKLGEGLHGNEAKYKVQML